MPALEPSDRNSRQVPGKRGRERSLHGRQYHRLFVPALHVIDDGEFEIESDTMGGDGHESCEVRAPRCKLCGGRPRDQYIPEGGSRTKLRRQGIAGRAVQHPGQTGGRLCVCERRVIGPGGLRRGIDRHAVVDALELVFAVELGTVCRGRVIGDDAGWYA